MMRVAFTAFIYISTIVYSLAQDISSETLKVAYIYNFTKYVTWSPNHTPSKFTIAVFGEDPKMMKELEEFARTKQINGKQIEVISINGFEKIASPISMLYVPTIYNNQIKRIANSITGKNILLITDRCDDRQSVMINFTYPTDSKIQFEINKSNLIYESFQVSKDILLLGGTELDVATLYKETDRQLVSTRKELEEQNALISKQLQDIQVQKKQIDDQNTKLSSLDKIIETQQLRLQKQDTMLANQNRLITENRKNLFELLENLEEKNFELQKSLHDLELNKLKEVELENKIRVSKNVLDRQNEEIEKRNKQIQVQSEVLSQQGVTIKTQKNYLLFTVLILILVLTLIFVVYRGYIQKKQSSEELAMKNESLAKVNDTLNNTLSKLKKTQAQLVQSENMASLGVLTAGIAHEINNPISFVSVGTQALRDNFIILLQIIHKLEYRLKDETKDYWEGLKQKEDFDDLLNSINELFEDVAHGVTRTSDIVKGLRDFSRIDESAVNAVSLHKGLDSTLLLLRSKLSKINLVKNYAKHEPLIVCNSGQINQVFMNIISNAIDAIEHDKGRIEITTLYDDKKAVIIIKDNGKGMKSEVMQRIFDPFYTTKDIGKGTGLGLSISYGIIQKHNGVIHVTSVPDKGTTFKITLPNKQSQDEES